MPTVTYQPDGTAGADTWVRQNAATSNFGSTGTLFLADVSAAARRLLIAIDMSAAGVPVGARVDSCTIAFTKQAPPVGTLSVTWQSVEPFVEGTVTWNLQPVTYGVTVADTITADAGGHTTPNLAKLVQFAANGNTGQVAYMRCICASEGSGSESMAFYSSDDATEANRPLFTIDYTAPVPRGRGRGHSGPGQPRGRS